MHRAERPSILSSHTRPKRLTLMMMLLCSPMAYANDDLCDKLNDDVKAGNLDDARLTLDDNRFNNEGIPCFDLILGEIEHHDQHFNEATFTLERVISVYPDNDYARLMLGDAYLATGQQELARQQWDVITDQTNDTDMLFQASQRLDDLNALEASQRWAYNISLDAGHDSNYNYGVIGDSVEYEGVEIPTGDALKEKASPFAELNVAAYYQASDNTILNMSLWQRSYTEDHHQTLFTAQGMYLMQDVKYPVVLSAALKPLFIDGEYSRLESSIKSTVDLSKSILPLTPALDIGLAYLSYEMALFDRTQLTTGLTLDLSASDQLIQTLRLGLTAEQESDPDGASFAKMSQGLTYTLHWQMDDRKSIALSPSMKLDQYRAPFLSGGDKQTNEKMNVALTYKHKLRAADVSLAYRYGQNDSNINFFDYQRHEVRAGIGYWF